MPALLGFARGASFVAAVQSGHGAAPNLDRRFHVIHLLAVLPLVGFQPVMIMTMQAISLLYQFWVHTELVRKLGPLEWIMNTPSHHRVHHGSNQRYLDRNHAGVLIIWNRLFG